MVTLGLLQYLTPTLQFLLGILYFHEDMPAVRWVGFVLVWVALAIFTADSLHHRRRTPRSTAEVAPV
jgi:chloramphenicol-sensitive protein RarD